MARVLVNVRRTASVIAPVGNMELICFVADRLKTYRRPDSQSREDGTAFRGVRYSKQSENLAVSAQVIQALLMEQITVTPSVQGSLYLRCAFVKQDCGMKQNPNPPFSSLYLLIRLHA